MSLDRKYLAWALAYAVVGMCLGIFMAASHDHREFVAHAHILLIGFVLSLGLWLLYGNFAAAAQLDPVLGIGAIAVLIGALLMLYTVISTRAVRT